MRKWPEALPERLQYEIDAFEQTEGLDFTLDAGQLDRTGQVVFTGTLTRAGHDPVALEIRYPDSFPYLRPEVFAHGLRLGRHQHPYRHNLCLLDQSTRHWAPSWTGARLVAERVPLLLDLLAGDPEIMRRQESPQGEPASYFLAAHAGSAIFIPEQALEMSDRARAGTMTLSTAPGEEPGPLLRAGLTKVGSVELRHGKRVRRRERAVARASGSFARRFSQPAIEGSWVRLDRFPEQGGQAEDLWQAAAAVAGFEPPPQQRVRQGLVRVLGVVCKEEVLQGRFEDSWVFAVELRTLEGAGRHSQPQHYIARGERLSPRDLAERVPTLAGLAEKKVSLAGLGALGAPLGLELARAQLGELRLLDRDTVEAGTTVRWPFGVGAVGHWKTRILADFIAREYPFTRARMFQHAVGFAAGAQEDSERSEAEVLTEFLDGTDLVVDATAEIGLQQLLAALADQAGIPQLYVSATAGGWGGLVARVVPGRTGCWYCLQRRIDEGSIVAPPAAENGTVQPRGCSAPTWTGSSFDALPLIAQAARTAAFTLLDGHNGDDVFVCSQPARTAADLAAPAWTTYTLEAHPACDACGGRGA
jgi:molybdopterin/thiamine biosynthesis adenylyltransferase